MPARPLLALCAFFVVLALSFPAYRGLATEDYSRETGRVCVECHLDPSGSKLWRKGLHVGKHQAGFDLTDVLKLAPHGEDRVFRQFFPGSRRPADHRRVAVGAMSA